MKIATERCQLCIAGCVFCGYAGTVPTTGDIITPWGVLDRRPRPWQFMRPAEQRALIWWRALYRAARAGRYGLSIIKRTAAAIAVLLLAGCTPVQEQMRTPSSISFSLGDTRGGAQEAANRAQAHCAETGRDAQLQQVRHTVNFDEASFICVARSAAGERP